MPAGLNLFQVVTVLSRRSQSTVGGARVTQTDEGLCIGRSVTPDAKLPTNFYRRTAIVSHTGALCSENEPAASSIAAITSSVAD
jgi:hypothetical protein